MALTRKRISLLAVAGVLALVAGIVYAGVFSGKTSNAAGFATSSSVPEDAAVFFAADTNLESSQWQALNQIAAALGQPDILAALREMVNESGALEWDRDIAPFLGGELGVYLPALPSEEDGSVQLAALLSTADGQQAWDRLQAFLEEQVTAGEIEAGPSTDYKGVPVSAYTDSDGTAYYAALAGDYVVIASDMECMQAVIDVQQGDAGSLLDSEQFNRATENVNREALALAYLDSDAFLPFLREGLEMADTEALEQFPGLAELFSGELLEGSSTVLTFEAQESALRMDAVFTVAEGQALPEMLRGNNFDSILDEQVPGNSVAFFSAYDILDGLDPLLEMEEVRDALRQARSLLGIDLRDDVIDQMEGEFAVAVTPPGEDGQVGVAALIEVIDEQRVQSVVEQVLTLARLQGVEARTAEAGGTEYRAFDLPDGNGVIAIAFRDNVMIVTYGEAPMRAVLEGDGNLAGNERYQAATAGLPDEYSVLGYVDIQGAIDGFAPSDDDGDVPEAARALSSLVFYATSETDRIGMTGILRIEQ